MRGIITSVALLAAAATAPVFAQSYGSGDSYGGSTIRCESNDGRLRECPTGGGRVVLERQISRAVCIEGSSWGYGHNGIWVSQGCRADFRLTGGHGNNGGYYEDDSYGNYGNGNYGNAYGQGQTIRCESNDNRVQRCALSANPREVQLVRQLSRSACIEGRTWGRERDGVWVALGCRAEFSSLSSGYGYGNGNIDRYARPYGGFGNVFRCESNDGRTRECAVNTRAGVQLVRQLSHAACIQGRTWGYGRNGIWVSQGCRAEFRSY